MKSEQPKQDPKDPPTFIMGEIDPLEDDSSGNGSQNSHDSDEDNEQNMNMIVAQYTQENRVKSNFKFNLLNVVMFIDGNHYFVKELKAAI